LPEGFGLRGRGFVVDGMSVAGSSVGRITVFAPKRVRF
jgi:hypothetical protein